MTTRLSLVALGALLTLSACNNDDHTLVQQGPADPMANQLANAAPPPALPIIAASKTYRCSPGNEVVEIDWTELNGKPANANLRVGKDAIAPVVTSAPAEGTGPYTAADGTSLAGTKDAATVKLTLPGKGALTCKG